jgi:sporulation protein YlmC with PRC-barrel domain
MLWNASAVNGYAIAASDGRLGTVSDFLFDDATWAVRWLVVDTGNWLSGRKVLLPPSALRHLDREGREFSVELSMQQVKDSPDIATDWPVSRQMETDVYDYYGWSPYWGMGLYMGGYGLSGSCIVESSYLESMRRTERTADTRRNDGDPHLRSIKAVTGYHVHASDGEVGHVEDFLLDDADWSIHFLIVDTKNWWPGKKVLISPQLAREINWSDRLVNLNADRQKVVASPAYDASKVIDGAYEKRFHDHYDDILAPGQP